MFEGCLPPGLLRLTAFTHRAAEYLRRRTRTARQAKAIRTQFYERVWREAAEQLGADFAVLDDKIHQIKFGLKTTNVFNNYTELDGPVTLRLAGDKALVGRLLRQHGIPTPRGLEFSLRTLARARGFLDQFNAPCVVKPARNSSAGQGVTTGITRYSHLVRAAVRAGAYSRNLLIEEQVPGNNYRLLFLDGEFVDAVHRRPPSVIGDGTSTIAELVRQANNQRLAGGELVSQVLLTCDDDMQRTLAAQGLSLNAIPAKGQPVAVKTVINDNAAEENAPARDQFCKAIVDEARRAVAAIGGRFVGVDVITTDPSQPLASTGGVILELNTTPGFYYHMNRPDQPCPVALYVLSSIFGLKAPIRSFADSPADTSGVLEIERPI